MKLLAAACEMAIIFCSAGCTCLARRLPSLRPLSLSYAPFLRTTAAMAKQKTTGEELNDGAKANNYQRGARQDKDRLRDQKKHIDKTKQNHDMTLAKLLKAAQKMKKRPIYLQNV